MKQKIENYGDKEKMYEFPMDLYNWIQRKYKFDIENWHIIMDLNYLGYYAPDGSRL